MSSTWGSNLKISIFGESHSKAIGIVIDGIPAGTVIDREQLLAFLARRSSRGGKLDTPRIEADQPQLLSGDAFPTHRTRTFWSPAAHLSVQ